jgi:V8-like Glu-specific endopeptidase
MKKKSITSIISAVFMAAVMGLVPTLICMALGTPRDPNGDGSIDLSDSIYISQFLSAYHLPSNLTSLDFDQSGVISPMDAYKVQLYNLNSYQPPDYNPNDPIEYSIATTRTYWRHDYNNTNQSSYYEYTLSPNYVINNVGNETDTIFGNNNMIRDYDTAVVKLSCGGTGFIVGDHTIATAAHCVYDTSTNKFFDFTIEIIDANNNLLQTLSPRYSHISKNFSQLSYDIKNDFALIYVTSDISQYGKFDLGVSLEDYANNSGQVIVSGFPQSYPAGYDGSEYGLRFKASGNLIANYTDSGKLAYDADMTYGDSGGPVFVEEGIFASGNLGEYKTAVGINVYQTSVANYGVRINEDLLKFYKKNTYLTP